MYNVNILSVIVLSDFLQHYNVSPDLTMLTESQLIPIINLEDDEDDAFMGKLRGEKTKNSKPTASSSSKKERNESALVTTTRVVNSRAGGH